LKFVIFTREQQPIKNLAERTYTNSVCWRKLERKKFFFCVIVLRSFILFLESERKKEDSFFEKWTLKKQKRGQEKIRFCNLLY